MVYNVQAATFRSYTRAALGDSVVYYSWASDGSSPGMIRYSATSANGSVAYVSNPQINDTLQLGSSEVTFIASNGSPSGNQVNVGANTAASLANLLAFLNASADGQIDQCRYSLAGNTLVVVLGGVALAGNYFSLAASTAGAVVSGPTLSGAGGMITMTAPIGDLDEFVGSYVYDCRMELGSDIVPIFGGTITFLQGVTNNQVVAPVYGPPGPPAHADCLLSSLVFG